MIKNKNILFASLLLLIIIALFIITNNYVMPITINDNNTY